MDTPQLLPAQPNIVGPVWRKTQDQSWWLPEQTLGWGVINWLANYVKSPGGEHAGEPFMPTLEQARFILWWYAVDDDGRYAYRAGVLRRLKGWGKDPLSAALALADLIEDPALSVGEEVEGDDEGEARGTPRGAVAGCFSGSFVGVRFHGCPGGER